MQPPRREVER
jgi:hypothetical protein